MLDMTIRLYFCTGWGCGIVLMVHQHGHSLYKCETKRNQMVSVITLSNMNIYQKHKKSLPLTCNERFIYIISISCVNRICLINAIVVSYCWMSRHLVNFALKMDPKYYGTLFYRFLFFNRLIFHFHLSST